MICPKCGFQNEPSYRFCMRCGSPLAQQPIASPPQVPVNAFVSTPPPPAPSQPPIQSQPVPPPVPQQPTQQPVGYQPPMSQTYPSSAPAYGGMQQPQTSSLNIWGPFAGRGARRRHIGWLMDGRGDRAPELVQRIASKFNDRQIPNTNLTHENLTAKGLWVETRPYFILRRGLVTLALNISQVGRDLFISLASYIKPPISNFRVLVVGLMSLLWLFTTFAVPSMISTAADKALNGLAGGLFGGGGTPDTSGLLFLLCFLGPIGLINGLLLLAFLGFSVYKWLTEKDFLAGLRVKPNEFNEDDLMAMEKAVEQTVRLSLDEIGLDPNDLKATFNVSGGRVI